MQFLQTKLPNKIGYDSSSGRFSFQNKELDATLPPLWHFGSAHFSISSKTVLVIAGGLTKKKNKIVPTRQIFIYVQNNQGEFSQVALLKTSTASLQPSVHFCEEPFHIFVFAGTYENFVQHAYFSDIALDQAQSYVLTEFVVTGHPIPSNAYIIDYPRPFQGDFVDEENTYTFSLFGGLGRTVERQICIQLVVNFQNKIVLAKSVLSQAWEAVFPKVDKTDKAYYWCEELVKTPFAPILQVKTFPTILYPTVCFRYPGIEDWILIVKHGDKKYLKTDFVKFASNKEVVDKFEKAEIEKNRQKEIEKQSQKGQMQIEKK